MESESAVVKRNSFLRQRNTLVPGFLKESIGAIEAGAWSRRGFIPKTISWDFTAETIIRPAKKYKLPEIDLAGRTRVREPPQPPGLASSPPCICAVVVLTVAG